MWDRLDFLDSSIGDNDGLNLKLIQSINFIFYYIFCFIVSFIRNLIKFSTSLYYIYENEFL